MRLAWEGLIPASLVCLLVTSAMVYFGMQEFMFIGGLASIALVLLGRPFLPRDGLQPAYRHDWKSLLSSVCLNTKD